MPTATIAARCHHEERFWGNDDRKLRIAGLEAQLDAGTYETSGEAQLACEAIKFHMIRLAGLDVQSALEKMGILAV